MIRRREKDSRRVAKSVRTHQETMAALGRASIKDPNILRGQLHSSTDLSEKKTYYINSNPSTY